MATIIVMMNFGVRYLLQDIYPYPYSLFIPSVIIVSLLFDRRTGFYASILSGVLAVTLLADQNVFKEQAFWGEVLTVLLFTMVGFFTAYVIESLRSMLVELENKNHEILVAQQKLHQAQKLEAVGQAMSLLAHDFRNALMPIMGSIDLLRRRVPPSAETEDILQTMEQACDSGKKLVNDVLLFAREERKEFAYHDPGALLDNILPVIRQGLLFKIDFKTGRDDNLPAIRVNPDLLSRALANLISNAQDAMPDGGQISVESFKARLPDDDPKAADADPGNYVCIEVSDTGGGIAESIQKEIFKPFFTTKPIGHGTGLGLAMVADFMQQAGGLITVQSAENKGTTIRLYFPAGVKTG